MLSISLTFARAASGIQDPKPGFAVIWLLVLAIAILDDSERREKDRRKREQAQCSCKPVKPRPPAGPRPF